MKRPGLFLMLPRRSLYINIVSAKYHTRGIVIQLGTNLATQVTGNASLQPTMFVGIKNLAILMAGNKPLDLPVEIPTTATFPRNYGFALPNSDMLMALRNDNIVVDFDPGIATTRVVPGMAGWIATGIDILSGVEQDLITGTENGDLILCGFSLKDYPTNIRLSK